MIAAGRNVELGTRCRHTGTYMNMNGSKYLTRSTALSVNNNTIIGINSWPVSSIIIIIIINDLVCLRICVFLLFHQNR